MRIAAQHPERHCTEPVRAVLYWYAPLSTAHMMDDAIRKFSEQFAYEPTVANGPVPKKSRYILLGMGGSHLAGDVLLAWKPDLPLTIHSDYGIPPWSPEALKQSLVIASSYSGNTEEVIEGFQAARTLGCAIVVIAVGGKLLSLAQEHGLPYIQMPDTGIQPRSALGFSTKALMLALGEREGLAEVSTFAKELAPTSFEEQGRALARSLKGSVPIVYASTRNRAIAYNWKIKLNETGKIPAFMNVFPELNHNEMNGFDVQKSSKKLSERFHFLLLLDDEDHPGIRKRAEVLKGQLEDRKFLVTNIPLAGRTRMERIFYSLLVADWCSVETAHIYGNEAEQVPMIEEFKKRIAS